MPKSLFVIDPEQHILTLVKYNLERAGYQVTTIKPPLDCTPMQVVGLFVEQVKENGIPGIIITELCSGEENKWGFNNCDRDGFISLLKKLSPYRDIPIIVLTQLDRDADVFRSWQLGVNCYLTKPFNPYELTRFVERIFESMESENDDEILGEED